MLNTKRKESLFKGGCYVSITLAIWAFFSIFSRMIDSQKLNSWDLTFLRFGFASFFIILYLIYTKKSINLKIIPTIILSLFGGVGYCLIVYTGFLYAPVSHSAIWLNSCIPISTFLLTWFFLKKNNFNNLGSFFIILGAIGLMLIYGLLTNTYIFSIGDIFFFFGSIFWAAYTLLLKKFQFTIHQVLVNTTLCSFIFYVPIYFIYLPKNILDESWLVILSQGIFHGFFMVIVSSITFIKSIELLGAFRATIVLALAPFIAVVLAIPILGEFPEPAIYIGMAGLFIATIKSLILNNKSKKYQ